MLPLSFGSVTSVCVCEPRHVCTAAICFGLLMSLMSKMRTPRKRSGLTGASTPCGAAVDAAARLLDRHEQQVAVDRHVALAARAHDRRQQLRLLRVLDVVDVEAVEVADEQAVAAEREVGVGEVQRSRRRCRLLRRRRRGVGLSAAVGGLRRGSAGFAAASAAARGPTELPPAPSDRRTLPASAGCATSSMFRAAAPASLKPGFRPTRGSLVAGRGRRRVLRGCAAIATMTRRTPADATDSPGRQRISFLQLLHAASMPPIRSISMR